MKTNHENTYWNGKGKYQDLVAQLDPLVPPSGSVPNAKDNPALETYRIARNCYYDLYNNGLGNRGGKEFHTTFGFDAFEVGDPRWTCGDSHYNGSVDLTQKLINRTESKMDKIILAAHKEQFPDAHPAEPTIIDLTPEGCKTPEGNKRVNDAMDAWNHATATVANLAETAMQEGYFTVLSGHEEDLATLRASIQDRSEKQEDFLRAVAGR